ncbi:DNA-binding MarR family transcriptional regulator [Rhizobium tibeticum]|uniref:DNA-binding transcriptional regulator, MarR family n=1 Tax=Rhizobium tibeticum TaxID=501024 RepID=A0A1H8SH15_9HYPH|nr:MarR family transcriptional regulator [Rhizobium tibeticum]MDP9813476.1 DNA-binding MarR family transcriptional regulator [Rhizobium tibeticum]SEI13216.1 MarR family protein [Rhizobium tibeticum]SEO78319.1 DNA-binding transcriptional regulator, MarR family [Rhizobium tibeticum]
MDRIDPKPDIVGEVVSGCLMTRARRISRVITSIYDQELRCHGLSASQFSMLIVIAKLGGASRAEIGRANFQDRTTLTRSLAPLLKEGWIEELPTEGGRSRPVVISVAGESLLSEAAPAWREAQRKASRLVGSAGAKAIIDIAENLPREDDPA